MVDTCVDGAPLTLDDPMTGLPSRTKTGTGTRRGEVI